MTPKHKTSKLSEADGQICAVEQFRRRYPKYRLSLQSSLNGIPIPFDKKRPWLANVIMSNAKKMGMVNGQSDLFLAVPKKIKGEYFGGLYIEYKVIGGKPSPDQLEFIDEMTANGYIAVIIYGVEALINQLDDWMKLDGID